MRGNITRRGKASWRIKFDLGADPITGKRLTRFVTVRGKRQDAERELTRLLSDADNSTLVGPTKVTVAAYLTTWFDGLSGLAPTTIERYRDIIDRQTIPIIGHIELQKLKPVHLRHWLDGLVATGGRDGRPLSARTVGHAYRVLRSALQSAVALELVSRNVADVPKPPKVEVTETEILTANQLAAVKEALRGHTIAPIVSLAIATGMRRGELLALQWGDVNLDGASLKVKRSLEQTRAGLRFKAPKTKHGWRTISLPPSAIDTLRSHRRQQLEFRIALGLGKPGSDALVFCTPEGEPISPNYLSIIWRRLTEAKRLPKVRFHALRHSHASALIAAGIDVVTVSRHGSPAVTLNVYAHLFAKTDVTAAAAIERVIG
jgi:integrase